MQATLFLRTNLQPNSLAAAQQYFSVVFFSLIMLMFDGKDPGLKGLRDFCTLIGLSRSMARQERPCMRAHVAFENRSFMAKPEWRLHAGSLSPVHT